MVCDALVWSFDVITDADWLEIIKTASSVAVAGIAFFALRNWKRQDKAKRESEFLDELIEAVHAYIVEMHKPVELLRIGKIGMASHVQNWEDGEEAEKAIRGAIAYIKKNGEQDAKRLLAALEAVQLSTTKLRSLEAKGQVFRFNGYTKCQNAVRMLTWHFDRLEAFAAITGSPSMNWQHPEVLKALTNVMSIDPDEIRNSIGENNVALLEFARETYERIYG